MSVDPNFNKFTYEHYVLIPNDGKRHEIIDGDHYVNPVPNLYHQTVSQRIQTQLVLQISHKKLGWVYAAPVDVQLTKFDVVQPDLVVVLNDRKPILTKQKIDGVPSLIMEILSPGNASHDRELKKQLYQRAGVPEYWIVDPDEKTIEQYVLEESRYVSRAVTSTRISLSVLPEVLINSEGLWDFDY